VTSPRGHDQTVSVVVAVWNGSRTLKRCLESIRSQSYPCSLVVMVDSTTTDNTYDIATQYADRVLVVTAGAQERRNLGSAVISSDIVGFVDSDMDLESEVVSEVVFAVNSGAGAVVIPERSFGETYWARVRAYERSFYAAIPSANIESPRFFKSGVFALIGGFDTSLGSMEDTAVRVILARRSIVIGRTHTMINHDEGALTFRGACRKKGCYAVGMAQVTTRYGVRTMLAFLVDRPWARRPWLLFRQPTLGVGVIALKSGETLAVLSQLLLHGGLGRARRTL
jgi:glycosyltransferase involved in cell wall biosynthesis